jgi:SNF2 family DNA or RNA helicase
MPKLTYHCPICSKELKESKAIQLGSSKLIQYKCGHIFSRDITVIDPTKLDFTAVDGSGKKAREYQKSGVEFILNSDFNCIIGDQMRLGKTPQALLALKNAYKERIPVLILVRSANLWQWVREYKVWCDSLPNGIFPIISTNAWIPAGFSAYIISMDTFGANAKCKCGHRYHEADCKGNGKSCSCKVYQSDGCGLRDRLKQIPFKLIIADEAHSFKNTSSNRSQALVDFVSFLNTGETNTYLDFSCERCGNKWIESGKVHYDKRIGHKTLSKSTRCPSCNNYCYVSQSHQENEIVNPKVQERLDRLIALGKDQSTTAAERSLALEKAMELKKANKVPAEKPCGLILLTGTVIKNRADEFFVPLNLVAPEVISSETQYQRNWLTQDSKGRYTRVKSYLLDQFRETIKPYYLRREKEDVYTDLPPLNRIFTVIEPEKDSYAKLYNSILDKLEVSIADKANPTYWDFADDLMELRRICGLMKLSWLVETLQENLEESESAKFAVGLHHIDIRNILYQKLGGGDVCWTFSGSETMDRKNYIETHYTTMPQRVGLLNMLAGGVGCDFHEIDNIIILERQWNSADEEQFEFRFYNPDLSIKSRSTNIEYVVAKGTLDEWWYDMVEEKRRIFGETISNNWSVQSDNGSFKQLVDRTLAGRL